MTLNELVEKCFNESADAGWWHDQNTGESLAANPLTVPMKISLIHSEVSEALEAHRRGTMDDKLPQYLGIETELADVIIRVCDLAGYLGMNLEQIIHDKMEYNKQRADHKPENRVKAGGKRY